jgi:excinuclease ABC subunit B
VRDLRKGVYDVLVGINLLREGLDIPEVTLVAVLDADREGFLRSTTSLVQTCGRAARNVDGRVILYADTMTGSMTAALGEMDRRREKQRAYNAAHGITPQTVKKAIREILDSIAEKDYVTIDAGDEIDVDRMDPVKVAREIQRLEREMRQLASNLKFEAAAKVRDKIRGLQELELRYR